MNWLYYLLEANLYLTIFYLLYVLLFSELTFYGANRWYLLLSCAVAFALPLLQIGILKPVEAITQVIYIQEPIPMQNGSPAVIIPEPTLPVFTLANVLLVVYASGVLASLILLCIKITKLLSFAKLYKSTQTAQYRLIEITEHNAAFSFFNYLFIAPGTPQPDTIIAHELVHIRQKHSADIVFLEIVKAINWFNPVVYLIQKSLKNLHEFIADNQAAGDKIAYSAFLVNNAYGLNAPAMTQSFFNNNLIKQRILMLNKPQSGTAARLKYLLIAPLAGGMLCLSTLGFSKNYKTFVVLSRANSYTKAELPAQKNWANADTALKLPPPNVVKNNFEQLTQYLSNAIKYPENALKNKQTGGVIINFAVDKSGKISDAKLAGKHVSELGDAALTAFKKFNGNLTAAPGTYAMGVNFITLANKYPKFPAPSVTQQANYVGSISVLGLTPAQQKELKPKQIVIAPQNVIADSVRATDFAAFYKYLGRHIRYPSADRDNKISGRVFAQLIFNTDNTIKDVKILRAPSQMMANEVIRVLKSYKEALPVKANANYTIPIAMQIIGNNDVAIPFKADSSYTPKGSSTIAVKPNSAAINYSLDEVVINTYSSKPKP